ncbi:hypothetical protein CMESO_158 (nucleomorph) [Chroomonas mesostigmatica CCMP1168]|uniref:Uncharacterized protein n=1 Tax=Chroomonas mesostigmatica CCMP1168 TaxID=1195612 RepID=J7GA34_9CRYP|nr:hypothetical protein CMESO_158 [Chroomonas mesostigmatica CCMP1168]
MFKHTKKKVVLSRKIDFDFKINFKSFDYYYYFWILNFKNIFNFKSFLKQLLFLENFFFQTYYQWIYFLEIFFFFNQKNKIKFKCVFFNKYSNVLIYFLAKSFFSRFFNYEFFQITQNLFYNFKIDNFMNIDDQKNFYLKLKCLKVVHTHTLVCELKFFQDQNFWLFKTLIQKSSYRRFSEIKTIIFELFFYIFNVKKFFGFGKYNFSVFMKSFLKKENNFKFFFFIKQILNECKKKEKRKKIIKDKKIFCQNLWIEIKSDILLKKTIMRKKKNNTRHKTFPI